MNQNSRNRISRAYTIAGVVLMAFCVLNLVIENIVYVNSRRVYDRNIASVQYLSSMNDKLSDINENVLLLVAGMKDNNGTDIMTNIDNAFAAITQYETSYNALGGQSALELRRYKQASLSMAAYQKKITELSSSLTSAGSETAQAVYMQELSPLQACATEMLMATIEIGTNAADANVHRSSMMHGISQAVLIALAVIGLIALVIAGRRAVAASDEIERRGAELEEASEQLDRSRQKMVDAALMNILTGMYNRYALEERLEGIIGTGQFNIAVFDIDRFRGINDGYGYETGDEYLSAVAERLEEQYAESAELYNICGGEFCLLFDESISDLQVQSLAEQVRQSMGAPVNCGGITLQSSVSGSLWHVLPNENMTVGDVLMKLDNAMHAAKRDGGNRLYYIK